MGVSAIVEYQLATSEGVMLGIGRALNVGSIASRRSFSYRAWVPGLRWRRPTTRIAYSPNNSIGSRVV